MNSSQSFGDNDVQELGKYFTNFFDFLLQIKNAMCISKL